MSYGTTKFGSSTVDNYNVATGAAHTIDTNTQAKYIIRRMQNDTKIDFNTDWKMITVMIGHMDVCRNACKKNQFEASADSAVENVKKMLDTLYNGLPRTFVNLLPIQG